MISYQNLIIQFGDGAIFILYECSAKGYRQKFGEIRYLNAILNGRFARTPSLHPILNELKIANFP